MTITGRRAAPRPKVLIDATTVAEVLDGLSVYIVNLIRNLPPESSDEFDYTILVNPKVDSAELAAAIADRGLRVLPVNIAPIGPRRDWDMCRFLQREGRGFDLIHITSNNYPFPLRNGICTIHDLTFMTWFDRPGNIPGSGWLARNYLSAMVGNSLRKAEVVIAVSASTKREIARLFRPAPSDLRKVEVIHEGWEHLESYGEGKCEPFAFENDGYLFFLGSFRVHKNLTRLLEGFQRALPSLPPGKRLVISGSSNRLSKKARNVLNSINGDGERVVFTGHVSNACVQRLYTKADAFIFPSFSEGFGLPVLEAFRYGTPLLAANTTSLPEVAGDAAIYFDPFDTADIARAITDFYRDPGIAARLREAGRRRLELFSWKKTAAQTVAIYRRLLGSTPAGESRTS